MSGPAFQYRRYRHVPRAASSWGGKRLGGKEEKKTKKECENVSPNQVQARRYSKIRTVPMSTVEEGEGGDLTPDSSLPEHPPHTHTVNKEVPTAPGSSMSNPKNKTKISTSSAKLSGWQCLT